MKTTFLAAALLAISSLALAACGSSDTAAEAADPMAALEVSDARLVLPAVSGNPSAVYLSIANTGDRDVMIRGGSIGDATLMIHKMGTWEGKPSMDEIMQLPIAKGETVVFDPGEMHLMTSATPADLAAGGKATVTLSFVGGKTKDVEVEVLAAGDDRTAGAE